MGKYKKELLFTLAVLAAAAGLWLATHAGRGTGNVAVVRYGDPQVEQRIDLSQNADYDIDTGTYTVHLHVENGGIAFVNSPCPDHLCEGFGILQNAGDLVSGQSSGSCKICRPSQPSPEPGGDTGASPGQGQCGKHRVHPPSLAGR